MLRVGLVLVALAGCSGARGPVQLLETQSGRTVDVEVGQSIEVRLRTNPNTGYYWTWADSAGSHLHRVAPPSFETDAGGIGGSGTETWRFTAAELGEGTLTFVQQRPMSSDLASRQVRYVVRIIPARNR